MNRNRLVGALTLGTATVVLSVGLAMDAASAGSALPTTPLPSPSVSDVVWCTSEAPPSSTPGGPSYLPQCPGPYVSPTGASSPVPGTLTGVPPRPRRSPGWLHPQTSAPANREAGCR